MLAFFALVSSKVAVDSILAGAGLGMSIYGCVKGVRNRANAKRK